MSDDDLEVVLEREDSAWDALKQRFVQAAARGAYIDVESGDVLSSRDAEISAASEATAGAVPAVMTGSDRPISPLPFGSREDASPAGAIAAELRAARALLVALRNTLVTNFEQLSRLGKGRGGAALRVSAATTLKLTLVQVTGVNARIRAVQTLVNANLPLVRADAALLRQIEILNQIATKANILIHDINAKGAGGGTRSRPGPSTSSAAPRSAKRQRADDVGSAANPIVL